MSDGPPGVDILRAVKAGPKVAKKGGGGGDKMYSEIVIAARFYNLSLYVKCNRHALTHLRKVHPAT